MRGFSADWEGWSGAHFSSLHMRTNLRKRFFTDQPQLPTHGTARLYMAIILFIAGTVGFLASFTFLHLGLIQMIFRYPLAVLVAYGAFLFLLWLWLGRRNRRKSNLDLDPGTPDFDVSSSGSIKPELGSGGRFGGGGAGRSWAASPAETATHFTSTPINSPGGSGSFFDH